MLGKILKLFVGDKSKKDLKTITPIIDQIHSFEDEIGKLSNDELRNQTSLFKEQIKSSISDVDEKIENLKIELEKTKDFDIIMKLDADIILPKNYLSEISKRMLADINIGICGGICFTNGSNESITNSDHVRGAIKSYRKKCLIEIGGLLKEMGWDTIDEHNARFLNWKVEVFNDLKVHHTRKTNKNFGYLKAGFKNGKMLYSMRMDFFLMLTNVFKWSFRFPYSVSYTHLTLPTKA